MSDPTIAQSAEVDLLEVWDIIKRYRWVVSGIAASAACIAIAFVLVAKPQWEATAVLQVGQVGQYGQVGQSGRLIEPVARTVERMNMKTFASAVLTTLKIPLEENDPVGGLYRGTLKVRPVPNTDLVEIGVRAHSPEEASLWADTTVKTLSAFHEQIAAPSKAVLTQQLEDIKRDIATVKAAQQTLRQRAESATLSAANLFSQNMLLATMIQQRDNELRGLENQKLVFEEQLSPLRTYPTSLLAPVSVTDRPVWPKKKLTVVLASLGGLLVGVIAAFLLNAKHSRSLHSRS